MGRVPAGASEARAVFLCLISTACFHRWPRAETLSNLAGRHFLLVQTLHHLVQRPPRLNRENGRCHFTVKVWLTLAAEENVSSPPCVAVMVTVPCPTRWIFPATIFATA